MGSPFVQVAEKLCFVSGHDFVVPHTIENMSGFYRLLKNPSF